MPPFCAPFCDSEGFRALSRFAKGFGESVDIERVPTGRDKTPVLGRNRPASYLPILEFPVRGLLNMP